MVFEGWEPLILIHQISSVPLIGLRLPPGHIPRPDCAALRIQGLGDIPAGLWQVRACETR